MKHEWMRSVVVVAALALVTGACGDGDGDSTSTAADAASTTTAAVIESTTTEAVGDTTTTEAVTDGDVSCDEPVIVGLITDQTGALAIYGDHMVRGVPAGFEYATGDDGSDGAYSVGGCDIELIIKDDQSDAELSATAARELIEVDGADIIIGSVSSGVTATLQGIASETDTILIAAPAAANDLTGATYDPNTFRASRNGYQDAMAVCEYLTKEYDTFVQIAPDDAFGSAGARAYRDACSASGGEFPVDDILAPADTTDFTPYLEQVDAVDADVVLVTWAGGGFIELLQAATDLGVLETKALGSPFVDNVALPAFFSNAIGSTSSILYHYSFPDNPANDFLVAAAERQGTKPDLFDADGMNAAIMVVEALRATGGAADADALRAALEGLSFEGPKGTIEIRPEDHVAVQDLFIATLLNVDDPEFMFFEYIETVRPQPPCLVPAELERCGDLPAGSLTG